MDLYPCDEDLNRKSPDLWPEKLPTVCDAADKFLKTVNEQNVYESIHLEPEDISFMNELGKLTPDQVMDQIKKMQQTAYNLGRIEQQELRRGALLRVLEDMLEPSESIPHEESVEKDHPMDSAPTDSTAEEPSTPSTEAVANCK
ncbi:protein lin 52 [Trichuris trichiura]|uniref:Protein lin 52 n=1 Tax=Trichuris trichiura TaxID=36087 RepID=A0A077Z650_TRITR|nr:protein lin 52 [Trichuris trichiura]